MIKKKNSLFTFMFSLLPGAGEMYMGFMKKGVSIMFTFFLIIFLAVWLNLGPLMFIMPILWFYSFFNVHNLRALPDDEFYAVEDEYFINVIDNRNQAIELTKKYRTVIAVILILTGCSILWNNMYELFRPWLPLFAREFIQNLGYRAPQTLIAIFIVLFGFYLIRGKKKELDLIEDKGGV